MDVQSRLNRMLQEFEESSVIPKGIRGAIFAMIDNLVSANAPKEQIEIVRDLSVGLQKLEWATMKHDEERMSETWQQLRELSDQWLTLAASNTISSNPSTVFSSRESLLAHHTMP